jgi:hypothetical protein
VVTFLFISIFLLLVSIAFTRNNKNNKNNIPPTFALVLNGVLFLSLVVFIALFMKNSDVITQIPAPYYWLLLFAGLIIEIFSFRQKYIPGHFTAAAIHCFVGFVAIFSIGLPLLVLALIEICIAVYQHRKN